MFRQSSLNGTTWYNLSFIYILLNSLIYIAKDAAYSSTPDSLYLTYWSGFENVPFPYKLAYIDSLMCFSVYLSHMIIYYIFSRIPGSGSFQDHPSLTKEAAVHYLFLLSLFDVCPHTPYITYHPSSVVNQAGIFSNYNSFILTVLCCFFHQTHVSAKLDPALNCHPNFIVFKLRSVLHFTNIMFMWNNYLA